MYVHPVIWEPKGRISWILGGEKSSVVINPFRDATVFEQITQNQHTPIRYVILTYLDDEVVLGASELARKGVRILLPDEWEVEFPYIVPEEPIFWEGFFIQRNHPPATLSDYESIWEWERDGRVRMVTGGPLLAYGGMDRIPANNIEQIRQRLAQLQPHFSALFHRYEPETYLLTTCFRHEELEGEFQLPLRWKAWVEQTKDLLTQLESDPWLLYKPMRGWHQLRLKRNRTFLPLLDEVLKPLEQVVEQWPEEAAVIDVRSPDEMELGFVPGSWYLPLSFLEEYAEKLILPEQPIVLVGSGERLLNAAVRLARLGADHFIGRIDFDQWRQKHQIDMVIPISADELEWDYQFDETFFLVDVRPSEIVDYEGIISSAENIPLEELLALEYRFKPGDKVYVYGRNAEEALMGAIILRRKGAPIVRAVQADFETLKEKDLPVYRIVHLNDAGQGQK